MAQVFDVGVSGRACGIVSVDSAPARSRLLQAMGVGLSAFVTRMFYLYPWATLKKTSAEGNAATPEGRAIMDAILAGYEKGSTVGFPPMGSPCWPRW